MGERAGSERRELSPEAFDYLATAAWAGGRLGTELVARVTPERFTAWTFAGSDVDHTELHKFRDGARRWWSAEWQDCLRVIEQSVADHPGAHWLVPGCWKVGARRQGQATELAYHGEAVYLSDGAVEQIDSAWWDGVAAAAGLGLVTTAPLDGPELQADDVERIGDELLLVAACAYDDLHKLVFFDRRAS